ncbi:Single-stranded DNA-binding protein [Caloramator mitchellensis]|uniref:Single-stranded DNA-binding protein n=1 Tax=Caloramator mitchellensis TaxID=908809 RepID=A0A0R3JUI7_CALMK|nr:single-stranded DNA-binding protein [Caloramator mitchellensis]KRQ87227.1 Single-stranded DNA-binding protein [Caloramator mitchellensis]
MQNLFLSNKAYIEGKIVSPLTLSHEIFGERFLTFMIEVPRLSETVDVLPVTVSERLLTNVNTSIGTLVSVDGQIRSYNRVIDGSSRLLLTLFARDIKEIETLSDSPNVISLDGYVCKAPVYRTTPFGREITDILIAVNRAYNKSDYIPAIAWGRNARFSSQFEVGTHIRLWGRMQSREYEKKLSEDNVIKRTAYEVSISKLEKVSDE